MNKSFSAGTENIERLIETNTVAIKSLRGIAPNGTMDPSVVYNIKYTIYYA